MEQLRREFGALEATQDETTWVSGEALRANLAAHIGLERTQEMPAAPFANGFVRGVSQEF